MRCGKLRKATPADSIASGHLRYSQTVKGFPAFDGPLTYLLLISSFIFSAMSKSAGGLADEAEDVVAGGGLDIDFLIFNGILRVIFELATGSKGLIDIILI